MISEQAANKSACSFNEAAAGVVVRKDRRVRPHESQPSRSPERMER